MTEEATEAASFQAAFGPLAHHFFPDGCPVVVATSADSTNTEDEAHSYLQQVWPASTSRTAVSPAAAIQSISNLKSYACTHGLTTPEMVAVAYVAAKTAAFVPMTARNAGRPQTCVKVHSPLHDGSALHFCSLIRSLLPRSSSSQALSDAEKKSQEKALVGVACRLISACCCRFGGPQEELAKTRRCVVRFLTLVVRWLQPIQCPQACVSAVLQWALQPLTCVDSIRLMWYMNETSFPTYRLNQLKAYSKHLEQQHMPLTTAKAALADFLERYDDQRMESSSRPGKRDWLCFPDEDWEIKFIGDNCPNTDEKEIESSYDDFGHRREWGDRRLAKRSRPSSRNLQKIAAHMENTVGPTGDDSSQLARFLSWTTTASASDMLKDGYMQQLSSLSTTTMKLLSIRDTALENGESAVLHMFRIILSHKLHEQWYAESPFITNSNDGADVDSRSAQPMEHDCRERDKSPQLQLLRALAEFAQSVNGLPIEAEVFILQNILPVWDGDIIGELGRTLLTVLPYIRPPLASERCSSFAELVAHGGQGSGVGQMFYQLERLFIYGNDQLQYAIVSGALAALVFRWGLLDWSSTSIADSGNESQEAEDGHQTAAEWKSLLLREICQWTDDLLLKGFLATEDGGELLRAAAVDFYLAICDLTDKNSTATATLLAVMSAPSPSLMYQLLLSSSTVHVDRACLLMFQYKGIFQKWKQQEAQEVRDTTAKNDASTGMKRIKVFNCVVWDFCSVLWRCSRPPPPQNVSDNTEEGARAFSILYTDLRPATQQRLYATSLLASSNPRIQNFSLASSLSITHGAVFSGYASDFLQRLRDAPPLVGDQSYNSPDQIQGQLKVQYLDYLKSRGLRGIHEFLSTFVEDLAARKMA